MKFKIFKLNFKGAVHFGEGGLVTSGDTLMADTIFSALCSEAAALDGGIIDKLVEYASAGKLLISDGLPYIGKSLYVPRPMLEIRGKEEGDSKIKKALKKLRYIPVEKMNSYLNGEMDVDAEAKIFQGGFSISDMAEKVTVPEDEQTRPYAVAIRRYREGSGLYICAGYETEEIFDLLAELLESLSYAGIGGERSSGYGRFDVSIAGNESLIRKLQIRDAKKYMSISVCLPEDDELDDVIKGADYLTVKRSGWVSSSGYADTMRKKKDIYMLAAGSVFSEPFRGGVYDVGEGGRHPVYRYGKPMLMAIV